MSQAARQASIERFGVDRVVPQYEAYYAEVLAGAGPSATTPAPPAPDARPEAPADRKVTR